MKIKLQSSVGRRRTTNQDYADYFQNSFQQFLFILCDGVGGHLGGDVASTSTTKFLGQAFKAMSKPLTVDSAVEWIHEQVIKVNHFIIEMSQEDQNLEGMGTTLVLAIPVEDQLIVAHVGDSRLYIFNESHLTQVTEDHSLVNELIKTGEITREEGKYHPQRNVVTQSIGNSLALRPEIKQLPLEAIDVLMLCSDGLTNMVPSDQLEEFFLNEVKENLAERLVSAANDAGGSDNITVILVWDLDDKEVNE